ncbi:hypothetical protein F7725_006760 [Dissostichus mawsoni]|uniref:Uncharacterized protein n=1 Tax=Dissostichus mawsoni TaxID=36200 RepID=A0A7J5XXQ7_DISMA|nr:hypothetical protein F7725_006760 [Dissostichus mawsoni]
MYLLNVLPLCKSQFLYLNPLLPLLRPELMYLLNVLPLYKSQFLYLNPLLPLLGSQLMYLLNLLPLFCIKTPFCSDPSFSTQTPSCTNPAHSPVTSPSSTPGEAPASAKMRASGRASVDGGLTSPSSTGPQTMLSKTEELQGQPRERRIPQQKASGLSKIPVVGGGRAGRIPVRDSQHDDEEASRVPPTPVLEKERPHFNSHEARIKDKICNVEANVPTSKNTQEESQQLPQPKVLTSLPRDSKIPVKHGAPPHAASQIPQAKEPYRTKIPVSKVPVRRADCDSWLHCDSTRVKRLTALKHKISPQGAEATILALWC